MYTQHFADYGHGVCEWGNSFMFGHPMFGGLFSIFLWFVLLLTLIWIIRTMIRTRGDREHDSALRILRERYASGEVTREEFDKMKSALLS